MYPGISLFYPKLAKAVLEYRVRTIEGASANAQQMGYRVQWVVLVFSSRIMQDYEYYYTFTLHELLFSGVEVSMGKCSNGP